jgi:hypothetical protein
VDKLFGVQTDPERIRRKARKRERQRLLKTDDVAAAEMEALKRLKAKIKLGAFHFDDGDEVHMDHLNSVKLMNVCAMLTFNPPLPLSHTFVLLHS